MTKEIEACEDKVGVSFIGYDTAIFGLILSSVLSDIVKNALEG